MTGNTVLWIVFVLITAAVIFETTSVSSLVAESSMGQSGAQSGARFAEGMENCSTPNAWLASCLDISASAPDYKIADYATANKVIQYLQSEVQDISGRYNVTWNLSPVIMTTSEPPPYTAVDQIRNYFSPADVRINGQVPNLTLSINYPPPLKGPVGSTGPQGSNGIVGATGPQGPLGPVGMSI